MIVSPGWAEFKADCKSPPALTLIVCAPDTLRLRSCVAAPHSFGAKVQIRPTLNASATSNRTTDESLGFRCAPFSLPDKNGLVAAKSSYTSRLSSLIDSLAVSHPVVE